MQNKEGTLAPEPNYERIFFFFCLFSEMPGETEHSPFQDLLITEMCYAARANGKWGWATMFCASALTSDSPIIPACIKPQTSTSVRRIQSLSQTAVKTKESAAFSDNLAAFRSRRCASRCTSTLFTEAGISRLKSICGRALGSHHAAVIVSKPLQ